MKILILINILFFISHSVYGHVHTLNGNGEKVKWPFNSGTINFYFNTGGCNSALNSCSSSTMQSIAQNSANEWSNNSSFSLNINSTSERSANNVNDIYFSSSSSIFGSGVVAVTQSSYRESSGEILESDIVLNSAFQFSTSSASSIYLGNVLSHELGHMLGISHGQTFRSTMFYTLNLGQHTLGEDDKSAVKNLYQLDTDRGVISGKIVGGPSSLGIFGAHVQAISSTTGIIQSSVLSGEDGSFKITNLGLSDIYYLYIGPTKLASATLPEFYKSIKNNFCNSGQSFRGSFFQTCNNSEKGEPQGIYLSSGRKSVNVGNVTIRCNLDVPVDYSVAKEVSAQNIDLLNSNGTVGHAQTGFFSSAQTSANTYDEFTVDLSAYSLLTTNLYLEVRIISQNLYSQLKTSLAIQNGIGTTTTHPTVSELDARGVIYDSDLAPSLNYVARFPLSVTTSNNVFNLKLTPTTFSTYLTSVNTPTYVWGEEDFYPSSSKFSDGLIFYLMTVNIVKLNPDSTYSRYSMPTPTFVSDNSSCVDAPRSYSTSGFYSTSSSDSITKSTKVQSVGCGSIDLGSDGDDEGEGGGGVISFVFGLLLSLAFVYFLKKRSNKILDTDFN